MISDFTRLPDPGVEFRVDQNDKVSHIATAESVTVMSPVMVCGFPRLNRDQVEQDKMRGMKVNNFSIDITMKGAQEHQTNFRAYMDEWDKRLLDLIVKYPHLIGTGKGREVIEDKMKPAFRPRANYKTGVTYPDAMSCRSGLHIDQFEGVPVVDVDNNMHLEPLKYNDLVRVVLSYNGPYVIRGSMFGNSWKLAAVQFVGKSNEAPTQVPFFDATDMSQFPAL